MNTGINEQRFGKGDFVQIRDEYKENYEIDEWNSPVFMIKSIDKINDNSTVYTLIDIATNEEFWDFIEEEELIPYGYDPRYPLMKGVV